ncbi:MAG TPA: hypothetical protein VK471_06795 [Solirubrobacterales bacterium]|nr:hypothetical protein [Solirubrobacterales bacterium]
MGGRLVQRRRTSCPESCAARYRYQRLTVPTRMLFMVVEPIGDSGHFIADERPELVAERARELFAPGP